MKLTHSLVPFDDSMTYVARKAFRFEGRDFQPGEVFPVAGRERRAKIMYSRRFIGVGKALAAGSVISASKPVTLGEHGPETVVPLKANAPTVAHRGSGWYDVFGADGKKLNADALRRKDAEALAQSPGA